MSSSSLASSVSATTTAPLALTTPFVPPPDCSHWTPTSIDTSTLGYPDDVPAVLLSSADPSCYPSGVVPESGLYYSPAVCPSGWIYNDMAEYYGDYSSAYCCQSGFTYAIYERSELIDSEMGLGCGRMTTNADANSDAGSTLLVHEAWAIAWAASDTSTLSPEPPTLTNDMRVPTWTPGEVIPDGMYDVGQNTNNFLPENLQWFLMVGMPIIGALLIGSCVFCCVRSSKKKRRARRAAAERAQAGVPS